tara:strand:+ start:43 stop:1809 length:1767 start_codon:yes stop_codon:yes gene_type:complete
VSGQESDGKRLLMVGTQRVSDDNAPAQSTAAVLQHVDAILGNRVPANAWIRAAAARHRADMDRDDLQWNPAPLESLVALTRQMHQVRGEGIGQPLELQPWQLWVLGSLLCWEWPDGRRRFRTGVLCCARKQGKSAMAAALLTWHLVNHPAPRAAVLAAKQQQAGIILGDVQDQMAHLGQEVEERKDWRTVRMGDARYRLRSNDIQQVNGPGKVEALSSNQRTLEGLDPSCYVADEVSSFSDRGLVRLSTAIVGRSDAFGLLVSTPSDRPNVWNEYVGQVEAVLQGDLEDDSLFGLLYGAEDGDEPDHPDTLAKANPSLGVTVQVPTLQQQYQTMSSQGAASLAEFKQYHLAIAMNTGTVWLPIEFWDKCGGHVPDLETMRGHAAWIGVDCSRTHDLSAVVALVEDVPGRYWVVPWFTHPQDRLLEVGQQVQRPLDRWARDGWIQPSPGGTVDYEAIHARILELAGVLDLRKLVCDPYGIAGWSTRLQDDLGDERVYRLPQSVKYLVGPTLHTEELIRELRVVQDESNECMRSNIGSAVVWRDPNGQGRMHKAKSRAPIDGAMALVLATAGLMTDDSTSGYEDRGVLVL